MAKKPVSLGKGLGALLPPSFSIEPPKDLPRDDGNTVGVTAMIELSKIRPNPMQPREDFDPVALEDLKKSIKEKGVIQPITVRRTQIGYEIIAGERRFRASTEIGLETIPAYILDIETDAEMLELALIENVQRENLNPIEVAIGYKRLMEECNLTQEEVSKKVGKDRTTVTNFMRLLKLPHEIQASLRAKSLSMGHARAILSISDEALQREVFRQVRDSDLSVRRTEELVKKVESGMSVGEALLETVERQARLGARGAEAVNAALEAEKARAAYIAEPDQTINGTREHAAHTALSPALGGLSGAPKSSSATAAAIHTEGFAIPDDLREEFAPAKREDSGVGATSASVQSPETLAEAAELNTIASQLRHILATQVRIRNRSNGSGVIEIEYFSADELERLRELFGIIEREQYS
jgi:ParB family chromosome partitioning protein